MKIHRFLGNYNLSQKSLTLTDRALAHQIQKVLVLKKGEELVLCDGNLHDARARITAIAKHAVEVEILEVKKLENEPSVHVTLYCSILKNNNFDLVAEKATEIGVKTVVPVIAARSIKLNLKTDRIRKIMKEAVEQCGRGIVPALEMPMKFKDALACAKHNNLNILLDPQATDPLPHPLPPKKGGDGEGGVGWRMSIGVFIGPEGGWTDEELALAREHNFKLATLGPLAFRAETAAIIASYLSTHISPISP